jgi:hypothetical protein
VQLRQSGTLLSIGLMLSLSANVFLLLRTQAPGERDSVGLDRTGPQETVMPSQGTMPIVRPQSPVPAWRVPDCKQELLAVQNCQQELARMRTQLADALKPAGAATPEQLPGNQANVSDARVPAGTLPNAEEFVRGQLNPSVERELEPELQRILSSKPNRLHTLQCRGAICRIELTTFADDQSWMLELQHDESLRAAA